MSDVVERARSLTNKVKRNTGDQPGMSYFALYASGYGQTNCWSTQRTRQSTDLKVLLSEVYGNNKGLSDWRAKSLKEGWRQPSFSSSCVSSAGSEALRDLIKACCAGMTIVRVTSNSSACNHPSELDGVR